MTSATSFDVALGEDDLSVFRRTFSTINPTWNQPPRHHPPSLPQPVHVPSHPSLRHCQNLPPIYPLTFTYVPGPSTKPTHPTSHYGFYTVLSETVLRSRNLYFISVSRSTTLPEDQDQENKMSTPLIPGTSPSPGVTTVSTLVLGPDIRNSSRRTT